MSITAVQYPKQISKFTNSPFLPGALLTTSKSSGPFATLVTIPHFGARKTVETSGHVFLTIVDVQRDARNLDLSRYVVVDEHVTRRYLDKHPLVKSDLFRSTKLIDEVFGLDTLLKLVVSPDAESRGLDCLMCFVHTRLERRTALGALKHILDRLSDAPAIQNEELDITVLFVK